MENIRFIIYLIMNSLKTWYGVKRPYHVIFMVWVFIITHTTLVKIMVNNLIDSNLCNVVWAYHVIHTTYVRNVVWAPLYIIGGHTIPRSMKGGIK